MTLHKGAVRLGGLYLCVLMTISIFFSFSIYQLSAREFNRGFRAPPSGQGVAITGLPVAAFSIPQEIKDEFETRFQQARDRIIMGLLVTNLLILVGGGALCYYLALRTLKPIEEAHEAQNRFTADASHELRTPITAMRTENEVTLMDPNLTLKEAKKQLTSNIEELDKLTALSEALLKLASFDASSLHKKLSNMRPLIEHAVGRVSSLAKEKGITVVIDALKDVRIPVDKSSIEETLVILLDNAIKYSDAKSIVKIGTTQGQKVFSVNVEDAGIGIKASELPHIFDRFYRADRARSKQNADGYGLGLAIAKSIVDLHGGTLSATSKIGQGSTFTISLPLN